MLSQLLYCTSHQCLEPCISHGKWRPKPGSCVGCIWGSAISPFRSNGFSFYSVCFSGLIIRCFFKVALNTWLLFGKITVHCHSILIKHVNTCSIYKSFTKFSPKHSHLFINLKLIKCYVLLTWESFKKNLSVISNKLVKRVRLLNKVTPVLNFVLLFYLFLYWLFYFILPDRQRRCLKHWIILSCALAGRIAISTKSRMTPDDPVDQLIIFFSLVGVWLLW